MSYPILDYSLLLMPTNNSSRVLTECGVVMDYI